ncbi:hypothetical protein J6590_038631 [Homalodisca vitripennis]|nr:hypothetical protein J6590_038631 [Homalodisca vitripennis]
MSFHASSDEARIQEFGIVMRASCVFWFEESKSATTVKRNFRTKYAKDPPSRPTIYETHSCFVETGTSDEVVEQVRQYFVNSPTKTTRRVSRELQVPHTTVCRVKKTNFCVDMLSRVDDDEHFLENTIFSDESTFYLSGKIDEDDRERNVFFMQDGAPPHYMTDVPDFLNDRFPGQ